MRILVAERLRPFCHLPGTTTILPGCGYQVQIFPCLIRIYHLHKSLPLLLTELSLDLKGPIQQFSVHNDLEKGKVIVSGKTATGWMRYYLVSALQGEGFRLFVEHAPESGFSIQAEENCFVLRDKEWFDFGNTSSSFIPYQVPACDRLSLGSHKAQDWELIKRRFDLKEILPLMHRLGQLIPVTPIPHTCEGTLSLLEDCRQSLISERPEKGEERWRHFLLGCWNGMLVPQLEDNHYQGLIPVKPLASLDISPLVILSEGARLIRTLFVQQDKEYLSILPYLLPSLSCGRLLNVPLEDEGMLSLEWTKKTIRRLILYTGQKQEWILKFHSHMRSYRLRQRESDKGERKNDQAKLFLEKNCHYLFDNFK